MLWYMTFNMIGKSEDSYLAAFRDGLLGMSGRSENEIG